MRTLTFNFHNEQEEKVLLAFLDSLQYDYRLVEESESFQINYGHPQDIIKNDVIIPEPTDEDYESRWNKMSEAIEADLKDTEELLQLIEDVLEPDEYNVVFAYKNHGLMGVRVLAHTAEQAIQKIRDRYKDNIVDGVTAHLID